ncbi:hypothetical protein AHMF7605_25680 [Adhaeribacter arboris]|uniref:Uncharacterized protein n=1 Tax=Adhaeribacter arboris TaxID=2072846 RepID=A0A2T2YMA4_9BACT|nr:hypothetical protein [Adhaeribacter arboris]PSR56642.1 hypothetical protein AHMF7605_25680 [Adhaeribacter arboris]
MEINNRELAGLIWIGIFIALVMMRPETRKDVPGLFKAAFQPKLSIIYGIMAAYTAIVVFLLYRIELWDSSQIKNTILWFLTVGLVSLNDITKHNQVNFFKKTALDILSLTAILQFITGVYTFSFIAEFILIPSAVLIGGMIAMAERKPEHISVKKLLNWILILVGLYTISFTIYRITTDFKTFASKGTLNDFFIPGALSFLFLPLVYLLSLYEARESAFIGLSNVLNPSLLRLAKWYTLRHFAFNKEDLHRWKRYIFLKNIESKEDLRCTIEFFKQLKKTEKNPPIVPIEMGWSPYKAKEVLVTEGIKTGHYQPSFDDECAASSTYFEIDDDLLANNIAYYIEGNSHAAVRLKLVLNVNDPAKADSAHNKMVSCANLLYRFAMNQDIPKTIVDALYMGKSKELQIGNKQILFYKDSWPDHRMKGYSLKLTIGVGNTSEVEL